MGSRLRRGRGEHDFLLESGETTFVTRLFRGAKRFVGSDPFDTYVSISTRRRASITGRQWNRSGLGGKGERARRIGESGGKLTSSYDV